MIYYVGSFLLIALGLYAVIVKKNLIKILIGLDLLASGVNLLIISVGYVKGGTAPIFSKAGLKASMMVDPIPQALTLTAIVIDASEMALAVAFVVLLYKHYKTLDIKKIRSLKW